MATLTRRWETRFNMLQQPTQKRTEFAYLALWASNELTARHHYYESGWVVLRHASQPNSEQCLKCLEPTTATTYFLFPPSAVVEQGDVILWGHPRVPEEEWVVSRTNRFRERIQCDVHRRGLMDLGTDEMLRARGLSSAAVYLLNADSRLNEENPVAWGNCIADCRNALQEVICNFTGSGDLGQGIRKLKDVPEMGKIASEYLEALERLLSVSRSLLSKSGAHPPLPENKAQAILALDLAKAIIRFMVLRRPNP